MKWLASLIVVFALAVAVSLAAHYGEGYALIVYPPYRVEISLAFAILLLPGMFTGTYFGPTYAAANNMVEPRMRATTAAFLLFANLFGLAAGPALVGFVSDLFTAYTFTLGDFGALCPGGTNADSALADICRASSARGIRYGLIVGALGNCWAGIHFFLAARTLRKDLQQT